MLNSVAGEIGNVTRNDILGIIILDALPFQKAASLSSVQALDKDLPKNSFEV